MSVPAFALHELGWHAFQQLCHTVLREVLGQTVVAFLDGNDGGRDGAFIGRWSPDPWRTVEGQFVVQCKHTSRRGHNITLSDLADELDKARRLANAGRCDVYVLMTNAGVSGTTEEALASELARSGIEQSLVFGATWLNQTIAENSRLRRLVPRLYGLGDLTQILDERAYRQARAVLEAMRADLSKLVLTGTYAKAAAALGEHGFVLLLGAAAAGKTTIAAELALGAADEFSTSVVKLDTIGDLQDHWNPEEPQLFWLDDAFGATQFERSLAREWTLALPRITAALHSGARFAVTSRDYVFQAARRYLKPGAFPLLHESQVLVDVADLTSDERRQILYNHLRHGRQPNSFVASVQPHLEMAADHPGYSPELARRLGEPTFTARMGGPSAAAIDDFFSRPAELLHDIMQGLDNDALAALGLIFISRNWVASPLELNEPEQDLVERFGSSLGGVIQALAYLEGSLTRTIVHDGNVGWEFAHPTMVDAYAELMRSPNFLHHFLAGFPLETLLGQITCGNLEWRHATVVPPIHYSMVLDRLDEPLPDGFDQRWRARSRRSTFLATRCDQAFLKLWSDRHPYLITLPVHVGLMLEAVSENELIARLHSFGLLPDQVRADVASQLIDYCLSGVDPAVVWNDQLRSILTSSEWDTLHVRMRGELFTDLPGAIANCTEGWDPSTDDWDAEDAIQPLRSLAHHLPKLYPSDSNIRNTVGRLEELLDEWVVGHSAPDIGGDEASSGAFSQEPTTSVATGSSARSVFDDLLMERADVPKSTLTAARPEPNTDHPVWQGA